MIYLNNGVGEALGGRRRRTLALKVERYGAFEGGVVDAARWQTSQIAQTGSLPVASGVARRRRRDDQRRFRAGDLRGFGRRFFFFLC